MQTNIVIIDVNSALFSYITTVWSSAVDRGTLGKEAAALQRLGPGGIPTTDSGQTTSDALAENSRESAGNLASYVSTFIARLVFR